MAAHLGADDDLEHVLDAGDAQTLGHVSRGAPAGDGDGDARRLGSPRDLHHRLDGGHLQRPKCLQNPGLGARF